MALSLITKCTLLRQFTPKSTQNSCQLHQLAAKLTASHEESTPNFGAGIPVLNCTTVTPATIGGGWSVLSVRHHVRNYFPRPREDKRLKFTWEKRILTEGGRAILMRRILKGRHSIGHPPSMLPHWPHKQY